MGDRANYVLISDGKARVFYDHWGALACIYAFGDGPADAATLAEQMTPTTELMEWAFAEGGFLIDFDQKHAIVFGDIMVTPEEVDEPNSENIQEFKRIAQALESGPEEYLQAIAPRWLGWHLTWDDHGVDAFSIYLKQRDIHSITCQSPSHPPDCRVVSHQA